MPRETNQEQESHQQQHLRLQITEILKRLPVQDLPDDVLRSTVDELESLVTQRAADLAEPSELAWADTEPFNLFMTHMPAAVFVKDTAGRTVYANERFAQMVGREPQDIVGLPSEAYTPPDLLAQYERENRQVLEEERTLEIESTFPGPAGPSHWVTYKFPIYRQGHPTFLGAVSVDVTQRWRAELLAEATAAALRESEARWRDLVQHLPDFVVIVDAQGKIITTNRVEPGEKLEDVIDSSVYDFVAPESRDAYGKALSKIQREGGIERLEITNIRGKTFLVRFTPLDYGDDIFRAMIIATDITQRKQAELALEKRNKEREILLQMLPVGITITDESGQIIETNQASEELLGISTAQHTGRRYDDSQWRAIRPDGMPMPAAEFASVRALQEQCTIRNAEAGIVRPDGEITWMNVTATPIPLEGYGVAIAYADITDLKKAEAQRDASLNALQKSQAFLDATQKIAHVGGWEFDIESREAEWTAETYRICEVDPDYVPTMEKSIGFFAPASRPIFQDALAKTIEIGQPYDLELVLVTARGNSRWVRTLGRAIQHHGKTVKVRGTIQDITQRKRAERALVASERKYRAIITHMNEGFALNELVYDEGGQVIDWIIREVNPAFEKILGLPPEKVIGRKPRLIFNADTSRQATMTQFGEIFAQVDKTGEPAQLEYYWPERDCYLSYSIYSPYQGYVAVMFDDITERKRMENALRESEERYRTLVEHAPVSIVVHAENKIVYLNPQAVETLGGTSAADFIGQSPFQTLHPDYHDVGRQRIQTLYQKKGPVPLMEQKLIRRDGKIIDAEVMATSIDFEGNPASQIVFRDITRRKKIETALAEKAEALARSNADLEHFAYVVSHDLQEPLRMITGFLQLLERRYGRQMEEQAQEYVHFAVDGAKRMQAMIRALLDLSRVVTRGRDLTPTESEQVLGQVLDNLRLLLEETGATVTHDPLPKVMADEAQLRQVFQNLVTNAVKFRGEAPPKINISAHKEGDQWRFTVKDNGIGIEPAQSERIFQIFHRAHGAEYEGLGIGLSICQKIIERHGGRIGVESQPGRGATFYFTLPAATGD
jgi:PAS domain S-box-containing protein